MTEWGEQPCSLSWKKSTASGSEGCVEVARGGKMILVRDSKNPTGAVLTFSEIEWKAFLVGARADEFNI